MPLPKIEAANPLMSDDGDDYINTIRQTIGKEPYLSFSRANEGSFQLNQLIHSFNKPAYQPGWPLYPSMKIQMQKCGKCSREFCSTISYRRHLRLHMRKLNLDKDSATKNRNLLLAFWDKLSVEEAMEIMSVDDFSLGGISGSSIIKALASFVQKRAYTSLPQSYEKSGYVLLDIVQSRPARFPISSQELFDILDDASENTFLCAGTAESVQKFVFNGDARQIGLEIRNLIACTSFLVEQKLVKACLAYKDAEALRYQKLLVDEEEAAQKRQAALMEKKRQKKLRQKERRAKELANAENDNSHEKSFPSLPSSSHADGNDSTLEMLEITLDATPEHSQPVNVEEDIVEDPQNRHLDLGAQQKGYPDLGAQQNFEHRRFHRQVVNSRWQAPKSHRYPNGFHTSHNYQALKPGPSHKCSSSRNSHTTTNGTKVWSVKPKSETNEGRSKPILLIETPKLPFQERKLLIGSIPIPLGNRGIQGLDGNLGGASESCASELSVPGEYGTCERPVQGDGNQVTANCSSAVLWRPVNRRDNGPLPPIHNNCGASEVGRVLHNDNELVQPTCVVESTSNGCEDKFDSCVEGGLKFSSHLVEAFLSQRWKEAITADHVELVLFSEGPPGHSVAQDDSNQEAILPLELDQSSILRSAENHSPVYTTIDSSATVKFKARVKPEKGSIVNYI